VVVDVSTKSEVSIETIGEIIFIISSFNGNTNFEPNFPSDVNPILRFVLDDENIELSQCGKAAIVSLIKSYMPNDWSLVLIGATNQVSNILSKLPIKTSKIYILDSLENQLEELRQTIVPGSPKH